MKLFKYENFKVTIAEEALLIKPFRMIWNRDRSECKLKASQELGFIYFFCDPRSDYMFIVDDDERREKIIGQEGLEAKWKPDKVIKEAMEVYIYLTQTSSSLLLQDIKGVVDKLRVFLKEIDLNEKDPKTGKPVYTLNNITSTIKQIPTLIKELAEAEKLMNKEVEDNTRMRGAGTKKIFEDGYLGQ